MRISENPGEVAVLDQPAELDVVLAYAETIPVQASVDLFPATDEEIAAMADDFGVRFWHQTGLKALLSPVAHWIHPRNYNVPNQNDTLGTEFKVRKEDKEIIVAAAKHVIDERKLLRRGMHWYTKRTDAARCMIQLAEQ